MQAISFLTLLAISASLQVFSLLVNASPASYRSSGGNGLPVSGSESPLTANVIKLTNCPPDHVLKPCRCSKFNINYLKPELLQTLHHRPSSYDKMNAHIICSSNDPRLDLSALLERIRSFYSKDLNTHDLPPVSFDNGAARSKSTRNFRFEDGRSYGQSMNSSFAYGHSNSSDDGPIEETVHDWHSVPTNVSQDNVGEYVQLFGFVSNALPYLEYELQLNRLRFEYIDLSYTNLRSISFLDRTHTQLSYESVQTLLLAYNQLENEEDEQISSHLATSRLVRELSKFTELKVLSLRGNRLKHFHLPFRRLRILHHIPLPVNSQQVNRPHAASAHESPAHSLLDENHTIEAHFRSPWLDSEDWYAENYPDLAPRHRERIQVEVRDLFPKLRFLDLAENHIKTIPPNAYSSLPHLSHLNLESNGIDYVYANAFKFGARSSAAMLNRTQIQNLEKNTKELLLRSLKRLQIVYEDESDAGTVADEAVSTYEARKSVRKQGRNKSNGRLVATDSRSNSNSDLIEYRSPIDQLHIYLGRNNLNCSKINKLAFAHVKVRLHLHLDLNNFQYVCEDNFGDFLLQPNVLSVNFRKNPLRCTHCENKWLYVAHTANSIHDHSNSTTNTNLDVETETDDLSGTESRYASEYESHDRTVGRSNRGRPLPTDDRARPSNQRPLKYDLSKLVNVKCSLRYDGLQTWTEATAQMHLMDFSLNSFTHCSLRKQQLVQAIKHYALFLRSFSVLPQSSLERIDQILSE